MEEPPARDGAARQPSAGERVEEEEEDGQDPDASVTERELLTYVGSWGFFPTPRQLERWHKADCLPRPQHHHPPGLRGSASRYPAHAVPQLLALCRLHQTERRLHVVRFGLWLDGFPIPLQPLRQSLRQLVLHPWQLLVRQHGAAIHDTLEGAERLTAQALPRLPRTRLGRWLRRHLPAAADQESFLTLLFQLGLGGQPAFESVEDYVDLGDPQRDQSLAEILVQALGLAPAQTDSLLGAPPWLPADLTPDLVTFARRALASFRQVAHAFTAATREELEQARTDLQALAVQLPQVTRAIEAAFGPNTLGFGAFTWIGHLVAGDPAGQAFLVLAFVMLRQAGFGTALDTLGAVAREQAPIAAWQQRLLVTLQAELPAIAALLRQARLRVRTPEAQAAYLTALHGLAEQHLPDLAAFWARHPDLREPARDQPSIPAGIVDPATPVVASPAPPSRGSTIPVSQVPSPDRESR